MKEAMLYERVNSKVKCGLCHRRCTIPEGKTGYCGVRRNTDGKLYSLVYGKLATYSINPIEKKPFFHFHPGSGWFSFSTVGCNFECKHCHNCDISQAAPGDIPEFDVPPEKVVRMAKDYNTHGISYTFTEPTIFFEYCYDTGRLAKGAGLLNNFVSNGYMTPDTVKLASEFLDAINIDLKGNDEHYGRICGGVQLENVLDCIKNVYDAGIHLEIVTLLIPGDNDDKDTIRMLAEFLGGLSKDIPWHLTRFYPCYKMRESDRTPISSLERAYELAKELGMHYPYLGNAAGHKYENTYCHNCDELLIERWGMSIVRMNMPSGRCLSCGTQIPIIGVRDANPTKGR